MIVEYIIGRARISSLENVAVPLVQLFAWRSNYVVYRRFSLKWRATYRKIENQYYFRIIIKRSDVKDASRVRMIESAYNEASYDYSSLLKFFRNYIIKDKAYE